MKVAKNPQNFLRRSLLEPPAAGTTQEKMNCTSTPKNTFTWSFISNQHLTKSKLAKNMRNKISEYIFFIFKVL